MGRISVKRLPHKRIVYTALAIVFLLTPGMEILHEDLTICLAKTIYAMGAAQSYDTQLALGALAMNRLEDERFPDTLAEVLNHPQGFVRGTRYDESSLKAAREVLMGRRVLPSSMVFFAPADRTPDIPGTAKTVGGYRFSAYSLDP